MRKYILIILAAICGWMAPSALADRLVSQEPRFIHRRAMTEWQPLPDYFPGIEAFTFRRTPIYFRNWDDEDYYDDDRVIVRRAYPVQRRVIIRDRGLYHRR